MAVVKYKDCSGADKSVDKQSTFEICATDPNSFEYNTSLWRVEEVGSCEEVKPACKKYKVETVGTFLGLVPAVIYYENCKGEPILDPLRARGGYIVEICSSTKPEYVRTSNIEAIRGRIVALSLSAGGKFNPLLALLTNSILKSKAPIIEEIGICGDGDQQSSEPPVPASRYYQLVPCSNDSVIVYTTREPTISNERVSISNPQDVGVPSNVNWTYNGQTTNADNPGVLAASVFSKNASGCTDTQEEILDGGLDRPKAGPYSIRIGVDPAGVQAKLNIDGRERTISSNNLFIISNFNPTSSSDTRRVPSINYSVGDLVQGTDSKGLVRDYIISNISETYSNGTERRTNNLNQGDRFKYVGQNVSFDISYTFYLELAENVQEDTTPPSPPVSGGPDGNTSNVSRTGGTNSSQSETVFQPR